jgi:hypothetical protein
MENWKEIAEVPGYFISDQGRVKNRKDIIIKPYCTNSGYYGVRLYKNSSRQGFNIHKLVMNYFGTKQPPNTSVDHVNREKNDNRITNLRWATAKEQIANASINYAKGSKSGNSKLTEENVLEILKMVKSKFLLKDIANKFNISIQTVSNIKLGKLWTHVQEKKSI